MNQNKIKILGLFHLAVCLTHSFASDKIILDQDRDSEKLLKKSSKLSEGKGRGLNYRIEGNVRTYKSLNREFLIHRALIEAHASKYQEAKEFLSKALEMHESDEIKKSQSVIISEIESLIKS